MESPGSKRRVGARDKQNQALDLRREGLSYRAIAAKMGIGDDTAYKYVQAALARLNEKMDEKAEEVRRLELDRLDHWLAKLAPKIEAGDEKAVAVAIKVGESRRKLLGADAPPAKQIIEVQTPVTADQLKEMQADLLQKLSNLQPDPKEPS